MNKRRALIRKQNESNEELKQNERNQKRENMLEVIDLGRYFELATTNKMYVNGLHLYEDKIEILLRFKGDFELTESMLVGEVEQKTNFRFRNIDDFDIYINAIDNGSCESDVVSFTRWLCKLNTPEFNK